MTHEFKKIVHAYNKAKEDGRATVLATVVALDGSSYRRPGVQMLILEDGKMIGAVSGGCVEKEVLRQATAVFTSGIPKMMTYDGRYRLGCEGILYILIEPFAPEVAFLQLFENCLKERKTFGMHSYYEKEISSNTSLGSLVHFGENVVPLRKGFEPNEGYPVLSRPLEACFQLLILGAEHDAVQLCSYGALTGWEVTVVASPSEEKQLQDFPGAHRFLALAPEDLNTSGIDRQTAVVLMTHSFVKDLKFLMALKATQPAYLGLLGPASRREKLLSEFLEHSPDVADTFFDAIRGPAGINIGAETPQEIAVSILSEILAVVRKEDTIPLSSKKGTIHSR